MKFETNQTKYTKKFAFLKEIFKHVSSENEIKVSLSPKVLIYTKYLWMVVHSEIVYK